MSTRPATDPDALRNRFLATRALSEALAAPLSDADATVQSMPDASPAKWHLAHTTWFLETFVLGPLGVAPFDGRFAYLFNSYYEGAGPRHARAARGMITRPDRATVLAWRVRVTDAVADALPRLADDARALVELAVAHEQQHQELLLTDILHLFAQNPLEPAMWPPRPVARVAERPAGWLTHPGGIVEVGDPATGFAFDCERPQHQVLLRPFALADRPVSCGEWRAFIDDGGYATPGLWLSDGWAWRQRESIEAPLYWRHDDSGWTAMTLSGRRAIDPAAPIAHVSHYEADAYASWAGARLPTEFEWEAVAAGNDASGGNQLDTAGPVAPVAASGLFGNVWEWTASAFLPYPGFRPANGVVGEYNGKFMSGQMVLRGSSCATPRGSTRATTRNFFPPTARWQFSGLRLARDG